MNRPCANRHSHIGASTESRIGDLLAHGAYGSLEDVALTGHGPMVRAR
jgi:hypothetical protein